MEKNRLLDPAGLAPEGRTRLLRSLQLTAVLALAGMVSGCANMPRMADLSDPLSAQEHASLGHAYLAQKEVPQASEQYLASLRKDPNFIPALLAMGNLSYDAREWDQARSYYKRILKLTPEDTGAMNNLAMVDLAEGKNLDRARELLEKALPSAGPLKPYLLDTLANIAMRQGRFTDARRTLDEAEAASPTDPNFERHLAESRATLTSAAGAENALKSR